MFDRLKRSQVTRILFQYKELSQFKRPTEGWIRTIRTLYGMSASFLAKKIGVVHSRVVTVETAEKDDRVTLETLRKYARALNCDLVYAFVPHEDPELFLKKHAEQKASIMIAQLQRTMTLEDQAISDTELKQHHTQLVQELLDNPKKIWDAV